jgi:hypothetical protein
VQFHICCALVLSVVRLSVQDIDFASKDKVMRLLDQAAASLDGSTGEDLGPAFKRYRQAVFKLNYKINKLKDNKKGGNVRHSILVPRPLCCVLHCGC